MKTKLQITLIIFLFFNYIIYAQWVQIGSNILGDENGDNIGRSISLNSDGSIIAVSSNENAAGYQGEGFVKIYENIADVWTQIGSDIQGTNIADRFGQDVSLSGDGSIIAIGAPGYDNDVLSVGQVKIFKNINDVWTQIGNAIDGEATLDGSGSSISLSDDGSIVAVGADGNDDGEYNGGHVRIYKNIADVWTQIGSDIDGAEEQEASGFSVALSGDGSTVIIGAPENGNNNTGKVRIYENIDNVWTQIGLGIEGDGIFDAAGRSVSLSTDGAIIAFGAISGEFNEGYVKIYENNAGTWTQIGSTIYGEAAGDESSRSIELNGNGTVVAIGAHYNSGNSPQAGHVRIYKNIADVWTQIGEDIDGPTIATLFGWDVSMNNDGSIVGIGGMAFGASGSTPGTGLIKIFENNEVLSTPEFLETNFTVYPNPATTVLNIDFQEELDYKIYTIQGKLLKKGAAFQKINIEYLEKGIYFINLKTDSFQITNKFIVE